MLRASTTRTNWQRSKICLSACASKICDVSKQLPLADSTFDSVFSNDVLCHIPGRQALLHELFRVLKPNARILSSDDLIIGGMVSHQEIAARSGIGHYLFSPPSQNESHIDSA